MKHSLLSRTTVIAVVLCSVISTLAQAQHLLVSKNAPVRSDSLSSSNVIDRVQGGDLLKISGENRLYGTGYWKAELPNGKIGFIYKTRVRYKAEPLPGTEELEDGPASGLLQVHMINVGQAEALYIVCPDGKHQMVIDSGDLNMGVRYPGSTTEFKNYIQTYQDPNDPIEVVISSHPHSDHIAGMKWLLQQYEVGLYVDNGRTYDSGTFRSLETVIEEKNISRKRLTDLEVPNIDFCPGQSVSAKILRPHGFDEAGMDPNDYSVIVRLDYGSTSFLFTGDAEHEMEEKLLDDPNTSPYLDVDFLKVGHHGSHSSSTEGFLEVVTPDIAAISSGGEDVATNSGYLHPRLVTINNLLPYVQNRTGIATTLEAYDYSESEWTQIETRKAVYITNNDGDLVFLSDGNGIWKLGDRAN